MSYLGPVALVAVSLVVYQLAQRIVSGGSNPWAPLLVAYVVGVAFCATALLVTAPSFIGELRALSAGSLVLGLAVVGIEFGYLMAHRAGWDLAALGMVGSVTATVLLAAIAASFLEEPLAIRGLAGIGCCVVGLALLSGRPG